MVEPTLESAIRRLRKETEDGTSIDIDDRMISDHILLWMLPRICSTMEDIGLDTSEAAELNSYYSSNLEEHYDNIDLIRLAIDEQIRKGLIALEDFRSEIALTYGRTGRKPQAVLNTADYWQYLLSPQITKINYIDPIARMNPCNRTTEQERMLDDVRSAMDRDGGRISDYETRRLDMVVRKGKPDTQSLAPVCLDVERIKYWPRLLNKIRYRVVKAMHEYMQWDKKWKNDYLMAKSRLAYKSWLEKNEKHLLDSEVVGRIGKPPELIKPLEYILARAAVVDIFGKKLVAPSREAVEDLKARTLKLDNFELERVRRWDYETGKLSEVTPFWDDHYTGKLNDRPGIFYGTFGPKRNHLSKRFRGMPAYIDLGIVDIYSFLSGEMGEYSHPKHQGSIEQDIREIVSASGYGQALDRLHEELQVIGEALLQYSFCGEDETYEQTKRELQPLITLHGESGLLTINQAADLGFERMSVDD